MTDSSPPEPPPESSTPEPTEGQAATPPPTPPSQPPPGVDPPPPPPSGAVPPPPPPPDSSYPVRFSVDYPDHELDKTSTLLRIFWVIPIAIVLTTIGGYYGYAGGGREWAAGSMGGLLVLPAALMIIFREKYPRWWFDFNVELMRFTSRVSTYFLLMSDEYPSTDERQWVHLDIDYPDVKRDLNRFMPLVKWLLVIPHFIILFFLWLGVLVGVIFAWFKILFTGRYPEDVFQLIEGVYRWQMRVYGYAILLVTDEYPPFSLSP